MCLVLLLAGLSAVPCAVSAGPVPKDPDPDGAAVWDHLKSRDYARTFSLWPGKKRYSRGTEPHGALLTTYVNGKALEGIRAKRGTLPDGSIVLKENHTPEKKLEAITVMYKVRGYNPGAGDWFWAKYAPDGAVLMEGRAEMCLYCHVKMKDNDYLFSRRPR